MNVSAQQSVQRTRAEQPVQPTKAQQSVQRTRAEQPVQPTKAQIDTKALGFPCGNHRSFTEADAGTPISISLHQGVIINLDDQIENGTSVCWIPSGLITQTLKGNMTVDTTPDGVFGLALTRTVNWNPHALKPGETHHINRQFCFTPLTVGSTTISFDLVQSDKPDVVRSITYTITVVPAESSAQ